MLPHTADLIVEAWGPDDLACAEEAARALIEICVAGVPDPEAGQWIAQVSGSECDLVGAVLDEVVFALDTSIPAPVSADVDRVGPSEVTIRLGLADPESVRATGAAPKAIVMLSPEQAGREATLRCRFIVDV